MTLPVPPSTKLILENSIAVMRDIILPEVKEDWARFNASLMVGALEYALYGLGRDRASEHRRNLAAAIERVRAAIEQSGQPGAITALAETSPFEAASKLLVWGQNNPGPLAREVQKVLHDELFAQLDEEVKASDPMKGAFAAGLAGAA
jgi:hypothetical protein